MKLTIFSFRDLRVSGGTMIRTLGYTYNLIKNGIELEFYNPYEIPNFLKENSEFKKIPKNQFLSLLLEFYSIFPKLLFFLKFFISKFTFIKKIRRISNPIIFLQNFRLGLFLSLSFKKTCIYDIHGILDLQREYLDDSRLFRKIYFFLELIMERNFFRYSNYLIATSNLMKKYLVKKYKVQHDKVIIGEEGFLEICRQKVKKTLKNVILERYNIGKNDKIILFAGNFKKFGGVTDLVDAFYKLSEKYSNLKLFLIGSGQEEKRIKDFISRSKMSEKVIIIRQTDYLNLSTYQSIADIIICPDRNNFYNQITPHIKIFDSLASGKPIIVSNLKCLESILDDFKGIEIFEPNNIRDLEFKISKILENYNDYNSDSKKNTQLIKKYTYNKKTTKFLNQIRTLF